MAIIISLAEITVAARFFLQPAEHLLFCKQLSKTYPLAVSVLGSPAKEGEGAGSDGTESKIFDPGRVGSAIYGLGLNFP